MGIGSNLVPVRLLCIRYLAVLMLSCVSCDYGIVGSDEDTCHCIDDRDIVHDRNCIREGYHCDVLHPCPDNYWCSFDSKCECIVGEICGIKCDGNCGCPDGGECSLRQRICREPLVCMDDSMCDETNETCQNTTSSLYYCTEVAGKDVGEQCEVDTDCKSNICRTGVCLQQCHKNSNCPGGLLCEVGSAKPACVAITECSNCSAENQICDRGLCYEGCRTASDCAGDCKVSLNRPLYGLCTDPVGSSCDGDEFTITGAVIRYCLIYKSCWTDEDCPSMYKCYTSEELDQYRDASFCARIN